MRSKRVEIFKKVLNNLDYEKAKSILKISNETNIDWMTVRDCLITLEAIELIKKNKNGYVKYPSWLLLEQSNNMMKEKIKTLEVQKEELRKALISSELNQYKGIWH